jgi:hypothetical protein
VWKAGANVRDYLFAKKILAFLSGVSDVPAEKRARMISEIDSSDEYRVKIGEKLIYLLDKAEDHETARAISAIFRAFLEGQIDYDTFLRASRAVQNIIADDLRTFVDEETERWSIHEHVAGSLLNAGLCEFEEFQIRVEDNWDHKSSDKYRVEGQELSLSITEVGRKVRWILCRSRSVSSK